MITGQGPALHTRGFWVKRALALSWFTIAYNLGEGIVSIWFGIDEASFALFGFGADSFIEVGSASLVLWRFRQEATMTDVMRQGREKFARVGIGALFLLLGVVTAGGAGVQLWSHSHPSTTLPGLLISVASLSFMFFLWRAKLVAADKLGSATMRSDANCSRACITLSFILFIGSLIFLILPSFWWADSVAALLLSILIAREGWETVQSALKGNSEHCCSCD